jgi:integrase/recombinase XerD
MNNDKNDVFAVAIKNYFIEYIPTIRGYSGHTLSCYRDTFSLLIKYVLKNSKKNINIEDLSPDTIIDFLNYLEFERGNSITTRNIRLAAIHSFFRYVYTRYPECSLLCSQILSIRFKKAPKKEIAYLERDELEAILTEIKRDTQKGERDYLLVSIMFNSGGRIQEVLDLVPASIHFLKPYYVKFFGKGKKERICPLWPQTIQLILKYIELVGAKPDSNKPIFCNNQGTKLTRCGANYILKKYVNLASIKEPSLRQKKIHPHCIRHSTAMHLLKSGVDIVTISHWLGHSNLDTTNIYTNINFDSKREALNKIDPIASNKQERAVWKENKSILEWLKTI